MYLKHNKDRLVVLELPVGYLVNCDLQFELILTLFAYSKVASLCNTTSFPGSVCVCVCVCAYVRVSMCVSTCVYQVNTLSIC